MRILAFAASSVAVITACSNILHGPAIRAQQEHNDQLRRDLEAKKAPAWASGSVADVDAYVDLVFGTVASVERERSERMHDEMQGLPSYGELFDPAPYVEDATRCVLAAESHSHDAEPELLRREAALWAQRHDNAHARDAYLRWFHAQPNMVAFRALVALPDGARPTQDAIKSLCPLARPTVHLLQKDPAALRGMTVEQVDELSTEIVVFLNNCDGVAGSDGDRTLFRDWVTADERDAYELRRRAEQGAQHDEEVRSAQKECLLQCRQRERECIDARGTSPAGMCDREAIECQDRCER